MKSRLIGTINGPPVFRYLDFNSAVSSDNHLSKGCEKRAGCSVAILFRTNRNPITIQSRNRFELLNYQFRRDLRENNSTTVVRNIHFPLFDSAHIQKGVNIKRSDCCTFRTSYREKKTASIIYLPNGTVLIEKQKRNGSVEITKPDWNPKIAHYSCREKWKPADVSSVLINRQRTC